MKDLSRIRRAMGRATRGLFIADAALTLALMATVAAGSLFGAPGAVVAVDQQDLAIRPQTVHVTAADVEKTTTGKVLFRTSAAMIAPKTVDELANYELKGISVRRGVPQAHVRDNKLKKLVTKRVGDTLGAYEIIDITGEGITVKRGAETVVLSKG